MPAINCHVDNRLLKAAIDVNQPLLQFVDGVDFTLVYTTLHDSLDLIINWIEIWTVWKPQLNLEKLSLVFFNAEPPQFHACIHTTISFTR